ncbi:hypothetical protein [Thalassotalea maritima]|uniref:hypothetical protein n=1 Tax=Thalassotalea maritima TaxID=3242416 RepID=UPI00352762B2
MKKYAFNVAIVMVLFSQQACANKQAMIIAERPSDVQVVQQARSSTSVINKSDSVLVMTKHQTPPPETLSKGEIQAQWYQGTLRYYQLEGGFYGFISDSGARLLPLNLDKELHQHGAKLRLFGYPQKNISTIQQWGTPFKVLKVEVLEQGKANPNKLY